MSTIHDFLRHITIPGLWVATAPPEQHPALDVAACTVRALDESLLSEKLYPGMRVAVGVGSRGMSGLVEAVSTVVQWFKGKGAQPFIMPAMGSHGGATAQGQRNILASLGISSDSLGCPVCADMEVEQVGMLPTGQPVYMAQAALKADGIFLVNRVKPHTNFSGPHESGLVKMLVIGLGKHTGAASCHAHGFARMPENLPGMAHVLLQKTPVLGGLGTVENASHAVCMLRVTLAEDFMDCDAQLLAAARQRLPRLPFAAADVLIVDEMGKNLAGSGMDPHVTGRSGSKGFQPTVEITRVAVLRLTRQSHGNAIGMGLADIITEKIKSAVDFQKIYCNALTAGEVRGSAMPCVAANDEQAVRMALKVCGVVDLSRVRMARIRSTLDLSRLWISQALMPEVRNAGWSVGSVEQGMRFDAEGHLADI